MFSQFATLLKLKTLLVKSLNILSLAKTQKVDLIFNADLRNLTLCTKF